MRLYKAARLGDNQLATDAYGTDTFLCQYEPMSFTKIDGVFVRKRTISAAPDVTMPARGAIKIGDDYYLVGHGAPDFWNNSVIRVTYVIQGADGLAELTSIAGALNGSAPVTAYAALAFNKYVPDANDSSRYPPQYEIFLAGTESAPADSLIHLGSKWYLVKDSYVSTSGLRISLSNEIAMPAFETASFKERTYSAATDSFSTAATPAPIMRLKWSEHFTYLSKCSEPYERGDQVVFALKAVTPEPSDIITLSDGDWRVLSAIDEGLIWSCHVRRN